MRAIDNTDIPRAFGTRWLAAGSWALVVFLFASEWYAYDVTRGAASPYSYYLGWSCFIWALAPLVLWFVRRHPIQTQRWLPSLAFHGGASIVLSIAQVVIEATVGWLRVHYDMSFGQTLAHYFRQHVQLYFLTYWALVAVAQFYRIQGEARERSLKAAQLESQLAAARLEALRSQLQPHFLFNTLHAAIVLVREDPKGAEDVLQRLSQLLRASLGDFQTNEVPLRKELEFLDCYMGIQQRRFGERLSIDLDVDQGLLDCAVPSLILQPLVENAIRHGVGKHSGTDVVAVKAFEDQSWLMLEICNRNSTLVEAPERLMTRRGVGLANTRDRLRQLYGEEQSVQLHNLQPRGVRVRLALPLRRIEDTQAAQYA